MKNLCYLVFGKMVIRNVKQPFLFLQVLAALLLSTSALGQSKIQNIVPADANITGNKANKAYINDTFGDFTEVSPTDSMFVTPENEDFWVISTAPADYDNDGDLDIAVLGYYVVYNSSVEYKLFLLRNNGAADTVSWDFSYTDVPLGNMSTGSSDLAWSDADGDGDLDLVLGTNTVTVIYRNNAGVLQLTDTELPGYWEDNDQAEFDLHSITWADFDNDGDPDLLLPSVFDFTSFTYRTALMRNDGLNGTGGFTFTETEAVFAPTMHAQSLWADYDGDQDLDLLLVNISPLNDQSFLRRYRNDGNGAFTGENILGTLNVIHGDVQWGDYDGDGDLDILIAGSINEPDGTYTPMALRIYRNDNENYIPLDVVSDLQSEGWFDISAATWADYDSDGDMDILLAGNYNSGTNIEGRARIYTNANGVFSDSGNELPAPRAWGDRGGTFSWFDIDGEGDLDYFIAGQYFVPGGNGLVEAQMHLYRNDAPGQNNPPSAPIGVTVTQLPDSTVKLAWLPGNDDHTPTAALTYDLELYHNNLPVSLPTRSPEPGNVSSVNEWIIADLQQGNYKWTLRTVDAAFTGSTETTGEFTIGVTTAIERPENLPIGYSLRQNFPNPVNTFTKIGFSIPENSQVILNIYNLLGEEIYKLVDEQKQAGNHEVIFNAGNLANGVYFYKIQAGSFSRTLKLTVHRD